MSIWDAFFPKPDEPSEADLETAEHFDRMADNAGRQATEALDKISKTPAEEVDWLSYNMAAERESSFRERANDARKGLT